MKEIVFPFKHVVDVHTYTLDFSQELQPDEVIEEGFLDVTVFQGVDPNPSAMIVGGTQVQGTSVVSQVKGGLGGVVYLLTFRAVTFSGNAYEIVAKLAVLVDGVPSGAVYKPLYVTSWPYPIDVIESADVGFALNGWMMTPPQDRANVFFSMRPGTMVDVLKQYTMKTEQVDTTFAMRPGTLVTILREYIMKFEAANVSFEMRSGTLVTVLIQYQNYPPEGADVSFSMQPGTLI